MQPFSKHTGIAVPLDRANVDTDQIIPAVYLKRIERTGFGQFLFHSWRFQEDGTPNPDFILNNPVYEKGSVLISGRNFGSGSSREHAPWALQDYGFRALIAPSFADIFHKNCFENGIVPVILPDEQVNEIMALAVNDPGSQITVDLERCVVVYGEQSVGFMLHEDIKIHEFRRHCLINGLDEIDLILQHEEKIQAFEKRDSI